MYIFGSKKNPPCFCDDNHVLSCNKLYYTGAGLYNKEKHLYFYIVLLVGKQMLLTNFDGILVV